MYVLMKVRSHATFGGKVVCDLGVQVAHEGSCYVECARGIRIDLIGLDLMSSAELST